MATAVSSTYILFFNMTLPLPPQSKSEQVLGPTDIKEMILLTMVG
jgi:hypothetical protein